MLKFVSLGLLGLSAFSAATPISKRAGGPSAEPIPPSCTISNPLLCTSAEYCPPQSGSPVQPSDATPASIYAYYLELDQPGSPDDLLQTCLEQCYGYGNSGECLSVYHAYNYPAPSLYGAPGGWLSIACIMYGEIVNPEEFAVVPVDQQANYTNVAVRAINCPS